jgi:YegS/Rv2252/BmrU family lipid kinase
MKRGIHVIFNPVAGAGKAAEQRDSLLKQLGARYGQTFEFVETAGSGDAEHLAREAIEKGAQLIIAVGGDGTINEVVNGFFAKEELINPSCELGIINCGTGGGFAQSLGLPADISDQVDFIDLAKAKPVDIGHVTYSGEDASMHQRYFVNECQMGIGADIVSKVGLSQKRFGGTVAFGSVTVSQMLRAKASRLITHLDDSTAERDLLGVVVGNGRYCAGGMQLTPTADPFDGLFDVLLIHKMSLLQRSIGFSKIYSGKHISSQKFSIEQARTVAIESTQAVQLEADGELLGYTPCKIRVLPGAIKVRC